MTDLSRGSRARRGGRRPGWPLLTALLVLAIGASSALVFTSRAELLKLAVILALWAAVVAAFVSVIYRRQSDVDQARVRDMKLVYDLQLDREISARREYELTVESQLRRELASELRAQAADEVAALRAELSALRTNLEILFGTELAQRPELETERRAVRGYSDWDRGDESPRDRVAAARADELSEPADDRSIIDVPEEPLSPPADIYRAGYADQAPYRQPPSFGTGEAFPGSHRRQAGWAGQDRAGQDRAGPGWAGPDRAGPPPPQPAWSEPAEQAPGTGWQPAGSDEQWRAPEMPGGPVEPTLAAPPSAERSGRHASFAEQGPGESGAARGPRAGRPGRRARARDGSDSGTTAQPAMSPPPPAEARHGGAEPEPAGAHTEGHSVAELLARLQATPSAGGRRRRPEA
ncbi:DUF6779 domain-containing protein [Mycobacterium sp.]|uniref:DUF6779 domain-containing protein n=1 Tax=Mycobacterium sp. TaxID=1785 RepID=UPI0031D50426